MSTLKITGARKTFGPVEVIKGVDMDVRGGEFIVVVGPSGCGKSTLLRMIAGLETATGGDILIDGARVNDLEPMERNVAMVFQNYALYPHMTVFANMAYSLKIAGLPKPEIEERVDQAAELLQLTDYLQRRPNQLSGGQRQRVAMGRAIVRKPALFLFDEPLSNLDAKLRVQMRLEIRNLQRKLGVTSVYVTHDQVEAMTMGDRLLVLNGGEVEQFGAPMELYQKPASVFVAQFIGSPAMNVTPARAESGAVILPGGARLAASAAGAADITGAVTAGFRPEHLAPDAEGPVVMRIEAVERLGAAAVLHGRLGGADEPITASVPGAWDAEGADAGGEVRFSIAPENIHLFDPASGRRL
ncbi:MAG: ABC transporter ATP-binding protein [Rhodospirillales bacterium]